MLTSLSRPHADIPPSSDLATDPGRRDRGRAAYGPPRCRAVAGPASLSVQVSHHHHVRAAAHAGADIPTVALRHKCFSKQSCAPTRPLKPASFAKVDGEPWVQGPAELTVTLRPGPKGMMLRRLPANSPAARMSALVQEALEASVRQVNTRPGDGTCPGAIRWWGDIAVESSLSLASPLNGLGSVTALRLDISIRLNLSHLRAPSQMSRDKHWPWI